MQPPTPTPRGRSPSRERTPRSAASPRRRAGTAAAPPGRRDGAPGGEGGREGGGEGSSGRGGCRSAGGDTPGPPTQQKVGLEVGSRRCRREQPSAGMLCTPTPQACLCLPPQAQGRPYLALSSRCAAGPAAVPGPLPRVRGLRLARGAAAPGRGWEHPLCAHGEGKGVSQESRISSLDLAPFQLREVLLKTPSGSSGASPLPGRGGIAAAPPDVQRLSSQAPSGAAGGDCHLQHVYFTHPSPSTEHKGRWSDGVGLGILPLHGERELKSHMGMFYSSWP